VPNLATNVARVRDPLVRLYGTDATYRQFAALGYDWFSVSPSKVRYEGGVDGRRRGMANGPNRFTQTNCRLLQRFH
jgi:hypothetical protein